MTPEQERKRLCVSLFNDLLQVIVYALCDETLEETWQQFEENSFF